MRYRNILLIDDDEDDQEIFLTALGEVDNSINCLALTNARVALNMLTKQEANPDLIFLDLNMPHMNGEQFLMEIKKRNETRDIPVIVLSTSSHRSTIELTKELGAMDFMSKPDKFGDLIGKLRLIFGK